MIHLRALGKQDNPQDSQQKESITIRAKTDDMETHKHKESIEQKLVLWKCWQTLSQTNQERKDLN